jgi:AraC-like DNA-binding protein
LGEPLFQQGDATNRLMCGMAHFDEGGAHPILGTLPEMMHFPMPQPGSSIGSVVSLIDAEMQSHKGTTNRIADRLTEALFLQLLNHYVSRGDKTTGFLAILRDRRVYRALTLIHKAREFGRSLFPLGAEVGMSRATLVRRFQDTAGIAPMA